MMADSSRASPSVPGSLSNGTSFKRKQPGDGVKYYAVRRGLRPGVYQTWVECKENITGYKGSLFQTFPTYEAADAYVRGQNTPVSKSGPTKYYAIQVGRVPGVYTDWPSASEQLKGVKGPKHRRFDTRAEAEAFVAEGRKGSLAASNAAAQRLNNRPMLPNGRAAPAGLILQDNQRDATGTLYEPGLGPLPLDADDGFDPNIELSSTGELVYKPEARKTQTESVPTTSSDKMLVIYTDGSSLSNGKIGARAGVGVYFGPGDRKNVSEALTGSRQTNQRAELTAVLRALEIAPLHQEVTIYTDSQYSIKCVTEWYKNWQRNGWQTANKKPVENKDLVQDIRAKMDERQRLGKGTYFLWVKGHANDPGNIEADRLAVEAAHKNVTSTVSGKSSAMFESSANTRRVVMSGMMTLEERGFAEMDRARQDDELEDSRRRKVPRPSGDGRGF